MSVPLRIEARYLRERHPSEPVEDLAARLAFSRYVRSGEVPSAKAIAEALGLDLKFNPDQPRVPAGNPDGGQWTDGGGREGGGSSDSQNDTPIPHGLTPALADDCWSQLMRDSEICGRLKSRSCREQAMERFAACIAGNPLPPFPYW